MDVCWLLILLIILFKLYYTIFYSNRSSHLKVVHLLPGATTQRRELFNRLLSDIDLIIKWCVRNEYPTAKKANLLKYNWKRVMINETNFTDHIAYVIDKNKNFYLCASTPEGTDEDENTMRYVVFHELGHMMSTSFGHNEEFLSNFLAILRVGIHLGLYVPVSYTNKPVKYCGLDITNSLCDSYDCNKMISQ